MGAIRPRVHSRRCLRHRVPRGGFRVKNILLTHSPTFCAGACRRLCRGFRRCHSAPVTLKPPVSLLIICFSLHLPGLAVKERCSTLFDCFKMGGLAAAVFNLEPVRHFAPCRVRQPPAGYGNQCAVEHSRYSYFSLASPFYACALGHTFSETCSNAAGAKLADNYAWLCGPYMKAATEPRGLLLLQGVHMKQCGIVERARMKDSFSELGRRPLTASHPPRHGNALSPFFQSQTSQPHEFVFAIKQSRPPLTVPFMLYVPWWALAVYRRRCTRCGLYECVSFVVWRESGDCYRTSGCDAKVVKRREDPARALTDSRPDRLPRHGGRGRGARDFFSISAREIYIAQRHAANSPS